MERLLKSYPIQPAEQGVWARGVGYFKRVILTCVMFTLVIAGILCADGLL